MARQAYTPVDVSGLSIEDIMKLDISRVSTKDLKKITGRLQSAANKRLKRFYQRGETSSAVRGAQRSGQLTKKGKEGNYYSSKGLKSREDIRKQFTDIRSFLKNKTSTKKGYDEEVNKFKKAFGFDVKNVNRGKNQERMNVVERVRQRLHERFPEYEGEESVWRQRYGEITSDIKAYTKGGKWDEDEVVDRIVDNVSREIEQSSQNYNDNYDDFMEVNDEEFDFPDLFE